uniref:GAG-pre-integrase domain-containing protein n=1 Tax=Chenopodium quinoa TaxID=63459 RepID=A0A803N2R3_CHEQI
MLQTRNQSPPPNSQPYSSTNPQPPANHLAVAPLLTPEPPPLSSNPPPQLWFEGGVSSSILGFEGDVLSWRKEKGVDSSGRTEVGLCAVGKGRVWGHLKGREVSSGGMGHREKDLPGCRASKGRNVASVESFTLWHNRLGHAPTPKLKLIPALAD